MSNISRRKFLKGAGAAALAVAAAGVLAGCSGDKVPGTDVPDVPEVTSETIDVYFYDSDTQAIIDNSKTMTVLKGSKRVKIADIPTDLFPKGYGVEKDGDVEIRDNGSNNRRIYVWLKAAKINDAEKDDGTPTEKKVRITLKYCNGSKVGQSEAIDVVATVGNSISASDFTLPDGLTFADPAYKSDIVIDSGFYKATTDCLVLCA